MYYFADTFLELYSRYCQVALTVFADNAYVASDTKHSEAIAFFRTGVVLFKLENISDRYLRNFRHGNAPLMRLGFQAGGGNMRAFPPLI